MLNYIIGPLLFIWLSYSIYEQIQHQRDVQQSWSVIKASLHQSNVWILATVIGLMLVNWGIEARKWQLQISGVEQISFISAFRAILAGQALGFNTINRIGESAGRAAFLKDGNRMRGVVLSFVGSMAQIIVTFVMGALSLLYMRIFILDIHKQLDVLSVFWLDGLIYVITVCGEVRRFSLERINQIIVTFFWQIFCVFVSILFTVEIVSGECILVRCVCIGGGNVFSVGNCSNHCIG
jgi:hypothetical protein